MRHFKKKQEKDHPAIFKQWLNENRCAIEEWINSERTGKEIWDEFGKTFGNETFTQISDIDVRNQILDALYEEQNGLCCYCANKIERNWDTTKNCWIYSNYAIEHFQSKYHLKNRIFDYQNLMLTCKESSKIKYIEIGKQYKGEIIQSIADIARLVDISETKILERNRNVTINEGVTIKIPIPPHCDDSKSDFDSKVTITEIIDPSLNTHISLIKQLRFLSSGDIVFVSHNNSDDLLIENSIKVLNLNCETLIDRRKNIWNNVERTYTENFEYLLADADLLRAAIDKLIIQIAKPNSDNELDPFYFVEVAFYKNLYTSQP